MIQDSGPHQSTSTWWPSLHTSLEQHPCIPTVTSLHTMQALQHERHSMALEERNYQAFALTYADVMVLTLEDLLGVLTNFPMSAKELHSAVTREILQHEIRAYSRAVVRLLTGKRSRHARLTGDPNGREAYYFQYVHAGLGACGLGASRSTVVLQTVGVASGG
jgi:hypothetical protein